MNLFTYIRNDEIIEFFIHADRIIVHRAWNILSFGASFDTAEITIERGKETTGTKSNRISIEQTIFEFFTYHVPCRPYAYGVHTCIFLYPESFYFYSLQLRGAIRARSKQAQTNPRSPSNDKCFRSAVVIGALLNPIPIMPISASTMRRLLASFGQEEGARKGVANTRPNKPRPMDLRSFRFPGIRGNRLPLYHPTVDFLRILERKLFRRIEIVFGIFWECFFYDDMIILGEIGE